MQHQDSTPLVLEVNEGIVDRTARFRVGSRTIAMTPPITPGYWAFRVRLSDKQAILGFPKFGTIGVGFAEEEDWNTNLPCCCSAEAIYAHIKHNKGNRSITKERCLEAIAMVQEVARPYVHAGRTDGCRLCEERDGSS